MTEQLTPALGAGSLPYASPIPTHEKLLLSAPVNTICSIG